MKVVAHLVELTEQLAIVTASVITEQYEVSVLGFARPNECANYAELAQARALVLARQILAEGLDAVNPGTYLTTGVPLTVVSSPPSTTGFPPPAALSPTPQLARPEPEANLPLQSPDPMLSNDFLDDVPW